MKKLRPTRKKNGHFSFFLFFLQCEPDRRFYFIFFSSDEGKGTLVGARRPNNILSVASEKVDTCVSKIVGSNRFYCVSYRDLYETGFLINKYFSSSGLCERVWENKFNLTC